MPDRAEFSSMISVPEKKIDTPLTQPDSSAAHGGRIYFIRGGDFLKIGYSINPLSRLSSIQTACPFELELLAHFPGTLQDEIAIMSLFARYHIRGEWFRCHPKILDYVDSRTRKRSVRRRKNPNQNLNGRDWIWL